MSRSVPSTEALMPQLRWALRHLYDLGQLGKSPLLPALNLSGPSAAHELQRILLVSIEALKPTLGTSPQARAWRNYRALRHRYAEQFSPQEVAKALGLSVRQLRRQESQALEALAEHLHGAHGLCWPPEAEATPSTPTEPTGREAELQYLESSLPVSPVDVPEMLRSVAALLRPLASSLGVRLRLPVVGDTPLVAAPAPTLRQALLNTMSAAVRAARGGEVRVDLATESQALRVEVRPQPVDATAAAHQDEYGESLEMARSLAALCGGELRLAMDTEGMPFVARLHLPLAERASVLVVDDNRDTLQLMERYLQGTSYPFVGTRDPDEAVTLAAEVRPRAIVLDVMLPGIDGWEILGRLREAPATRDIPVIVCTILPEEQLALSLGAALFLRKPISRQALLDALDRVVTGSG